MYINKKIIIIAIYISLFAYVIYRIVALDHTYIPVVPIKGVNNVWDFNLFDPEVASTIVKQCIIAAIYAVVIGLLQISFKNKIIISCSTVLILKLIPALFRHGVFDIQTVTAMIVVSLIVTILTSLLQKIISKDDLFILKKYNK